MAIPAGWNRFQDSLSFSFLYPQACLQKTKPESGLSSVPLYNCAPSNPKVKLLQDFRKVEPPNGLTPHSSKGMPVKTKKNTVPLLARCSPGLCETRGAQNRVLEFVGFVATHRRPARGSSPQTPRTQVPYRGRPVYHISLDGNASGHCRRWPGPRRSCCNN